MLKIASSCKCFYSSFHKRFNHQFLASCDIRLRYFAKYFPALTAHSDSQTNEGYLRIFGKLIGVNLRYVHSSVGIVIVVSLPRRIHYGTLALFRSFSKICVATHAPKLWKWIKTPKSYFAWTPFHSFKSVKRSQFGLRDTIFKGCFSP